MMSRSTLLLAGRENTFVVVTTVYREAVYKGRIPTWVYREAYIPGWVGLHHTRKGTIPSMIGSQPRLVMPILWEKGSQTRLVTCINHGRKALRHASLLAQTLRRKALRHASLWLSPMGERPSDTPRYGSHPKVNPGITRLRVSLPKVNPGITRLMIPLSLR